MKYYLDDKVFKTKTDFQNFLQFTIEKYNKENKKSPKTKLFDKEIKHIKNKIPLTEQTPWGGVSLKKVDVTKDFIQKLLVVQKYGILGFEIHKKKLEKLIILEGSCLILYSNHKSKNWKIGKISTKMASVGDQFEFQPYDEHGIIAFSNCVIEETSTNHLDDLTYIFKADQVSS